MSSNNTHQLDRCLKIRSEGPCSVRFRTGIRGTELHHVTKIHQLTRNFRQDTLGESFFRSLRRKESGYKKVQRPRNI